MGEIRWLIVLQVIWKICHLLMLCLSAKLDAKDAKEKTMAQFRDELAEKGYENAPEEDVLSYALFPQVAEEFFKKNLRSISTNKAKKLLGELLQIDDANELKKHLHDTLDN